MERGHEWKGEPEVLSEVEEEERRGETVEELQEGQSRPSEVISEWKCDHEGPDRERGRGEEEGTRKPSVAQVKNDGALFTTNLAT